MPDTDKASYLLASGQKQGNWWCVRVCVRAHARVRDERTAEVLILTSSLYT